MILYIYIYIHKIFLNDINLCKKSMIAMGDMREEEQSKMFIFINN